MKTWKKLLAAAAPALGIACALPSTAHAYAYIYGGFGCNGPAYISGHRALTPHCAGGSAVSLTSGAQADLAEDAWRQWWHLDTTNPAIWIDRWAGTCTNDGINAGAMPNQAWLGGDRFNMGMASMSMNCGFFGAPDVTNVDIEVNSGNTDVATHCRTRSFTEDGTWVHEIGHAYGYAHFDDWLSTMNTFTPDITSCRSDRRVRPSSDGQHAHRDHYGLPYAVDVGGSPHVQTCSIASGGAGCVATPGSTQYIPVGAGSFTASVQFTSMNMREAWPQSSIPLALWLSSDSFLNGGDTRVLDVWLNETFAGAIYAYTVSVTFNTALIAPGTTKCVLVQWDPNSAASEHDESDNVTDTNFCFYRL